MTVEADLYSMLKALVSDRVFPDVAPAGVAKPFVVFQQVGGEAPTFLERALPSKKNGRFQVTVWSDQRTTSAQLAIQIEALMVAATAFQAKPLGAPLSLYEEDTALRGSTQDFTVWSDR